MRLSQLGCSWQHPGNQLHQTLICAEHRRHLPAGQHQIEAVDHGMNKMHCQGKGLGLQGAIKFGVVHKSHSALKSMLHTRRLDLTSSLKPLHSIGHLGEHQLGRQNQIRSSQLLAHRGSLWRGLDDPNHG